WRNTAGAWPPRPWLGQTTYPPWPRPFRVKAEGYEDSPMAGGLPWVGRGERKAARTVMRFLVPRAACWAFASPRDGRAGAYPLPGPPAFSVSQCPSTRVQPRRLDPIEPDLDRTE